MLFVSNNHILCKFRGGQSATMLSNGSIVLQKDQVADHLGIKSVIVGESALQQGKKKLVLLEKSHGEMPETKSYILVNFGQDGKASEQGIYQDYHEQI